MRGEWVSPFKLVQASNSFCLLFLGCDKTELNACNLDICCALCQCPAGSSSVAIIAAIRHHNHYEIIEESYINICHDGVPSPYGTYSCSWCSKRESYLYVQQSWLNNFATSYSNKSLMHPIQHPPSLEACIYRATCKTTCLTIATHCVYYFDCLSSCRSAVQLPELPTYPNKKNINMSSTGVTQRHFPLPLFFLRTKYMGFRSHAKDNYYNCYPRSQGVLSIFFLFFKNFNFYQEFTTN